MEFNQTKKVIVAVAAMLLSVGAAHADVFGTGANRFTMDFVTISGATNPTSGYGVVNNDYRIGTYEITNDQWNNFQASLAPVTVTGRPSWAYSQEPYYTGVSVPTNDVSWYETAQFVNWLNTSTGHQAAYKFTGTQGTSGYTLATWSAAEADGTNLYRNKDAFYYLPTEDEWVKAAYWNGTTIQTYATKAGDTLYQGNGSNGGWNYNTNGYATNPPGPWNVGSGSQELNGTYDMMGNVWEWMESPHASGDYSTSSPRGLRGGAYIDFSGDDLASSYRNGTIPDYFGDGIGFRVASEVPEPASLGLLALGGLSLLRRPK